MHKQADVVYIDTADRMDRLFPEKGPFIVDFTGPAGLSVDEIFARHGTILADPWDAAVPSGLFTIQNMSDKRVAAYTPLAYQPALLELRRLLRKEEIGELAGIELSASGSFRGADLFYAAAHLLGPPVGWRGANRKEPSQDFSTFLWFANFGCSIKLDSRLRLNQLEIMAACRRGVLHSVPGDRFVRVYPAGEEAYGFPLPDGDGIYYNLLDVIDTVLSPSVGPAFSPGETAEAIRWVRECVDERPSLLL